MSKEKEARSGDRSPMSGVLSDRAMRVITGQESIEQLTEALKNPNFLKQAAELGERPPVEREKLAKKREARRFAAAISNGFESVLVMIGSQFHVCKACGSVVKNRKKHQRWHEAVNAGLTLAEQATQRQEPLG